MEDDVALVTFSLLSDGCIISEMLYRATITRQPLALTGSSMLLGYKWLLTHSMILLTGPGVVQVVPKR